MEHHLGTAEVIRSNPAETLVSDSFSVRKSVTVFARTRFVTFTFFGISHGRVNQVVLQNIENHAVVSCTLGDTRFQK